MPPLIARLLSELLLPLAQRELDDQAGVLAAVESRLAALRAMAFSATGDTVRLPEGPVYPPEKILWAEWESPHFSRCGYLLIEGNRPQSITARFVTWRPFRATTTHLIDLNDGTIVHQEAGIDMTELGAPLLEAVGTMLALISSDAPRIEHPPGSRLARRLARARPGLVLRPWIEIGLPGAAGGR